MIELILVSLGVGVIGFLFAPLGLGGGMLFVPLIHYVADWPIDGKLIAVSLILTGVVSWGSGITHRKEKFVDDDKIGIALWGAVPGAILGVMVVQLFDDGIDFIFKSLSLVLISIALSKYLFSVKKPEKIVSEKDENIAGIAIGSGIGGMLSSILAIGAGAIYVPCLQVFGKLKTRLAIGSSLNIMMIVVPIAAISHILILSNSQLELILENLIFIIMLVILTFTGAKLGASFGIKNISENRIRQAFISILVIIWIRYLFDIIL